MNDIIKRGVSDYQDFKDQLDAVDLGVAPEDFQGLESVIKELYVRLKICGERRNDNIGETFDKFRDVDEEDDD